MITFRSTAREGMEGRRRIAGVTRAIRGTGFSVLIGASPTNDKRRPDGSQHRSAPTTEKLSMTNNNSRTKQLATTTPRRKTSAPATVVQAPVLWDAVDWDAIDWAGICNDYKRLLAYAPDVFAKGVQDVLVERFASDFARRLSVEIQGLGHVKRGKSTHNVRHVVKNLSESESEPTQ